MNLIYLGTRATVIENRSLEGSPSVAVSRGELGGMLEGSILYFV